MAAVVWMMLIVSMFQPAGLPPPPGTPRPEQVDALGPDDVRPVVIDVPARVLAVPVREAADLALWIDPRDAAGGLLIAADRGFVVWMDLEGVEQGRAELPGASAVDVRRSVTVGGQRAEVVAAASDTDGVVRFWTIDRASRLLVPAGSVETDFAGVRALALRREDRDAGLEAWVADAHGQILRLTMTARAGASGSVEILGVEAGRVDGEGSVTGLAVDESTGVVFAARGEAGLWRYEAVGGGRWRGRRIDRVGGGRLVGRVGGLAILGRGERGYLIAASEGDGTLAAYERSGANRYVCSLRVLAEGVGGGVLIGGGLEASGDLDGTWAGGLVALGSDAGILFVRWTDLVDRSGLPLGLVTR